MLPISSYLGSKLSSLKQSCELASKLIQHGYEVENAMNTASREVFHQKVGTSDDVLFFKWYVNGK